MEKISNNKLEFQQAQTQKHQIIKKKKSLKKNK